jgi:hypothetical protein
MWEIESYMKIDRAYIRYPRRAVYRIDGLFTSELAIDTPYCDDLSGNSSWHLVVDAFSRPPRECR